MVLAEQFAGRAETADYFHGCGRGFSTPAEEFRWLIFFKGVPLVVLAVRAVFPAELPVLFRVFHYRFIRNDHEGKGMPRYLIDLVIFPQPQKKGIRRSRLSGTVSGAEVPVERTGLWPTERGRGSWFYNIS